MTIGRFGWVLSLAVPEGLVIDGIGGVLFEECHTEPKEIGVCTGWCFDDWFYPAHPSCRQRLYQRCGRLILRLRTRR